MTKIGSITLNFKRHSACRESLTYESENGGYKLTVPRQPDFDKMPDHIEITISTESQWVSRQEYESLPDLPAEEA